MHDVIMVSMDMLQPCYGLCLCIAVALLWLTPAHSCGLCYWSQTSLLLTKKNSKKGLQPTLKLTTICLHLRKSKQKTLKLTKINESVALHIKENLRKTLKHMK